MNVIVYSKDFEPITSIDLPMDILDNMERKGGLRLGLNIVDNKRGNTLLMCTLMLKRITWIDGTQHTVIITYDEEIALMLKPEWLTGQQATINLYKTTIEKLTKRLKELE